MKDILIQEKNYKEQMDQQVWPYLNARKRERYLKITNDKKLYVANFHCDNPDKVVVLSHGFTETSWKYGEIFYYFLQKGYEVYMPDHCGHGKSYRLTDDASLVHVDSYKRYVRDLLRVVALARREHPGLPLTLFGHSMGGGIACTAAGRKPEWIDRLVLSSPMIQPQTGAMSWQKTSLFANILCLLGQDKSYVFGAKPYGGYEDFETSASLSRARFDYYQDYKYSHTEAQLSAASFGWIREAVRMNHELMTKTYKNLTMPVLLLQAETDYYVSPEAQTEFMNLLEAEGRGNGSLVQIPESKHEIFNSSDEVVEKFFNSIFQL